MSSHQDMQIPRFVDETHAFPGGSEALVVWWIVNHKDDWWSHSYEKHVLSALLYKTLTSAFINTRKSVPVYTRMCIIIQSTKSNLWYTRVPVLSLFLLQNSNV